MSYIVRLPVIPAHRLWASEKHKSWFSKEYPGSTPAESEAVEVYELRDGTKMYGVVDQVYHQMESEKPVVHLKPFPVMEPIPLLNLKGEKTWEEKLLRKGWERVEVPKFFIFPTPLKH